ncbi:PLAT domain-containing protein 3-like [Mercurialis annua]|uniref:PLAT domain-containing protein 3-like n=1 Tax=Mercurialis annua TaxID=3986 RepID=UPI002160D9AF|nr:PLAT domain-containing protein 3-like [Mercurialis annua]
MVVASYILSFLICLSFSSVVLSETCTCTYMISVKTGTMQQAGTDAVVSLKFSDLENPAVYIKDLENYGIMEFGHDYFEFDNLDFFSYTRRCFPKPVCYIELSHDNSGKYPGWYVEYVDVRSSGGYSIRETKKHFAVNQWLAKDEPPYQLSTFRDLCPSYNERKIDCGVESVVDATI